jgi:hypothetical protein
MNFHITERAAADAVVSISATMKRVCRSYRRSRQYFYGELMALFYAERDWNNWLQRQASV